MNRMAYKDGTKMSKMIVPNSKPKMILMAIGFHIAPPSIQRGTIPKEVVKVVKRIGENLSPEAFNKASLIERPLF